MTDEELEAVKNLRSIRRSESYADSVLGVYATLPKGAFYDDLDTILDKLEAEDAVKEMFYKNRIEELEAFAQLVIEKLDGAALDDCENGVASANARAANEYLADFRHTREAIHKIKDKAAELRERTDDDG